MSKTVLCLGALCAALLISSAAIAQGAATPAQAGATRKAPAVTDSKTIGDWGVRCVSGGNPPCEMFQVTQDKAGKRIISLAIAYLPTQGKYLMLLTTPLGVSFAKGVKISASAYSPKPLAYLRCDNGGCYVEGFIDSAALDALTHSDPKASITLAAANGRELRLPFLLNGFSDAKSEMEKLAREKNSAALASSAASH